MRAASILAAFFGWGVAAYFAGRSLPGLSFLMGLGLGAGAMLSQPIERTRDEYNPP